MVSRPYLGCVNMTSAPDERDPRRQALLLYSQGYRITRVAER
ncbi:terminase gpP N-terminus-related DNA-binding protein [Pantoea agglomerans]